MLAELESEARRELTAAAADGRFEDLMELTPVAKELAVLAHRDWHKNGNHSATVADVIAPANSCAETTSGGAAEARQPRPRSKKQNYPQFLREKNDLVKLGWSPREKGAYEHRVPGTAVNSVVSAVAAAGKGGHRFTVEAIIKEIGDANASEQVPSYRVYAVVSWLKWAGLVLQHGRQGYTIIRPQTFASSAETAWQALPQR